MSQPFWYDDPSVLFGKDTWSSFVPTPHMSVPDALNAVVRFSVYLSALLFLTSLDPWYLLVVPTVMALTVFLRGWFPEAKKMVESLVSGYTGEDRTLPTPDNPFMNAPLTDILDNPNRPPAPEDITTKEVREKINDAFAKTSDMYLDTTDVYDLVQSQRNFHTVPEDDHAGLLKFLGKGARTDKLLSESYVVAKGTAEELPLPSTVSPAAPA